MSRIAPWNHKRSHGELNTIIMNTQGLEFTVAMAILGTGALMLSPRAPAQTNSQTIHLQPRWNLVGLQVEPADASPSAVFSTIGPAFKSAWIYDVTSHGLIRTRVSEGRS